MLPFHILYTELTENGSLFSLVGKRSMGIDVCCFNKRAHLCFKPIKDI